MVIIFQTIRPKIEARISTRPMVDITTTMVQEFHSDHFADENVMTDVTMQISIDLLSEGENLQPAAAGPLAVAKYIASATGWPTDYRGLVDACCDAARPLHDTLFANGYRAWLILIGAPLNAEKKARFPNYELARSARKKNLLEDAAMERIFPLAAAERTVGLYLMHSERFCDGCEFLTHNSWAHIILSHREDFLSETNLERIYQSGGPDNGKLFSQVSWLTLSRAVCPLGDVVVTTNGAFDDRWREVHFVYAVGNEMIRVHDVG
jgi:hypothetical protein